MKRLSIALLFIAAFLGACNNDSEEDTTKPVISDVGITANPVDCQSYKRGDSIPVRFVLTDDTELGNFNIEIHNNFDHHTHSTSSVECEMDAVKSPVSPFIFNQDYSIPSGLRSYKVQVDIPIPATVDTGDYHFMIRVTDKAGWQQLKAVAIKVVE